MVRTPVVRLAAAAGALAMVLAGCSSRKAAAPAVTPASPSSTGAQATASPSNTPDAASTVWLCRPGTADDPCTSNLAATTLDGTPSRVTATPQPSSDSPFDCFYVYPTVSPEPGPNADLAIDTPEGLAAVEQASRFSPDCQVWAPVYRQRTSPDLDKGIAADGAADLVAYNSMLAAWNDYLSNDNHGRPVILIGHSQGAILLIHLLATQFDNNPALRRQLVSAILPGGNVQVATGATTGGSFHNIPACTAMAQTGCVIAYSSFYGRPPADSLFGIPGQGVSVPLSETTAAGQEVLCTNPAALGSNAVTPLDAYGPALLYTNVSPTVATSWVEDVNHYSGACRHVGDATWLQITTSTVTGDTRPTVPQDMGPEWGLHLFDVNLALGNLVKDVAAEETAYQASPH